MKIFENEIIDKDELLEHFFSLFVAISMEVHSGDIKPEELSRLVGLNFLITEQLGSNKDKPPSKLKLASEKYDLNFADTLVNATDWVNFFAKGYLNKQSINKALKSTKYFLEAGTPDWVRLWYLIDLEDGEFISLQRSVQYSFEHREYVDLGVLKHVAGMFFRPHI